MEIGSVVKVRHHLTEQLEAERRAPGQALVSYSTGRNGLAAPATVEVEDGVAIDDER